MDADLKAKKRSKDMKEDFKTVLHIMIAKSNFKSWQEEERRVIEFFISPFIKHVGESLTLL